jgi:hypothetical protein
MHRWETLKLQACQYLLINERHNENSITYVIWSISSKTSGQ